MSKQDLTSQSIYNGSIWRGAKRWYGNWPGVPTPPALVINSPGIVVWLLSFTLQPKSPSFTEPFSVRKILAPRCKYTHTHTHTHTHGQHYFSIVTSPLSLRKSGTCYHRCSRHCCDCRLSSVHWRQNCFADRTTTHTSSNSSIDTSLIRDIYCGHEVLFETCIAIKFVDDDDDDDDDFTLTST